MAVHTPLHVVHIFVQVLVYKACNISFNQLCEILMINCTCLSSLMFIINLEILIINIIISKAYKNVIKTFQPNRGFEPKAES